MTMEAQPTKRGDIDADLVKKLAKLLDDTGLCEIELSEGNFRIRVAKPTQTFVSGGGYSAPAPVAANASASATPGGVPAGALTSPMVGNAYLSPRPGAAAFVNVGDKVEKGQTLLIIEAMKVMNPIPSPKNGVVKEILVTDGQPVEFAEVLLVIE
jgi:acetyl-CoA carboxylase biotin carboxyl carrier protein